MFEWCISRAIGKMKDLKTLPMHNETESLWPSKRFCDDAWEPGVMKPYATLGFLSAVGSYFHSTFETAAWSRGEATLGSRETIRGRAWRTPEDAMRLLPPVPALCFWVLNSKRVSGHDSKRIAFSALDLSVSHWEYSWRNGSQNVSAPVPLK